MNVRSVLASWLKANGYDGLVSDHECGCLVDDLQPCSEDFSDCEPGYRGPCPADCGDHNWHTYPRKIDAISAQEAQKGDSE